MFKPSKDAILINEAPKKCPKCETAIYSTSPKMSRKAVYFGLLGIPLAGLWMLFYFTVLFTDAPDKIYTGGVAWVIIIHSWPAYIMGILASRLPQTIKPKCFKCGWTKTYEIRTPKLGK